MKRCIVIVFAALLSMSAMAQLYILSANGKVKLLRGGKWNTAFVSDRLFETDILQTEPYGNVVIRDKKANQNYPVQSSKPQSVKDLIAPLQRSTPSLTAEFGRGLDNLIRGLGSIRDLFPSTGGGVYKGDVPEMMVARALLSQPQGSFYSVSMRLLDKYTLQPIGQVREGQSIILEITNSSDMPLFVNVIDRDAKGVDTALYDITELQDIGELYVPANSTIRLKRFPLKFAPANTTDQLILVAYPLPFSLSNVLQILSENKMTEQEDVEESKIGIYSINVPILPR